jgi:hypothetical protein
MNFFYYSHLKSEAEMSTLLNGDPILEQAYEKYKQFNSDERLRALDEAHQRYLHDLATDVEAAHEKGIVIGFEKGEAVGIEKGIEKERLESLLRILTKRLGVVPPAIHDRLHAIHDLDVLGRLTDMALDCQSLAELERALP